MPLEKYQPCRSAILNHNQKPMLNLFHNTEPNQFKIKSVSYAIFFTPQTYQAQTLQFVFFAVLMLTDMLFLALIARKYVYKEEEEEEEKSAFHY